VDVHDLCTVGDSYEELVFSQLPRLPSGNDGLRTDVLVRGPGGGAFITAVAAARLGSHVAICSDLPGQAAALLEEDGVRVHNVLEADEPHAVVVSLRAPRDIARVRYNGVSSVLAPRLLAAARGASTRHLHFALEPHDCALWIEVCEHARRRGTTTSWDFGWAPELPRRRGFARLLAGADMILVDESEALHYSGTRSLQAATGWWRRATRSTVIKRGERGARWIDGEAARPVDAAAIPVAVADLTGAGAAFNGGLLHGWLEGRKKEECLFIGHHAASECIRALGGISGLPRFFEPLSG
jgi:sugar/nucleoside kinase (ribokinase family)